MSTSRRQSFQRTPRSAPPTPVTAQTPPSPPAPPKDEGISSLSVVSGICVLSGCWLLWTCCRFGANVGDHPVLSYAETAWVWLQNSTGKYLILAVVGGLSFGFVVVVASFVYLGVPFTLFVVVSAIVLDGVMSQYGSTGVVLYTGSGCMVMFGMLGFVALQSRILLYLHTTIAFAMSFLGCLFALAGIAYSSFDDEVAEALWIWASDAGRLRAEHALRCSDVHAEPPMLPSSPADDGGMVTPPCVGLLVPLIHHFELPFLFMTLAFIATVTAALLREGTILLFVTCSNAFALVVSGLLWIVIKVMRQDMDFVLLCVNVVLNCLSILVYLSMWHCVGCGEVYSTKKLLESHQVQVRWVLSMIPLVAVCSIAGLECARLGYTDWVERFRSFRDVITQVTLAMATSFWAKASADIEMQAEKRKHLLDRLGSKQTAVQCIVALNVTVCKLGSMCLEGRVPPWVTFVLGLIGDWVLYPLVLYFVSRIYVIVDQEGTSAAESILIQVFSIKGFIGVTYCFLMVERWLPTSKSIHVDVLVESYVALALFCFAVLQVNVWAWVPLGVDTAPNHRTKFAPFVNKSGTATVVKSCPVYAGDAEAPSKEVIHYCRQGAVINIVDGTWVRTESVAGRSRCWFARFSMADPSRRGETVAGWIPLAEDATRMFSNSTSTPGRTPETGSLDTTGDIYLAVGWPPERRRGGYGALDVPVAE
eukprot:TRINITY_DN30872_c0_g1_i1.p1 TRINITY_DN30872_c0_g1~~TRINITY_DN30872_c0_g1_i1.p1  ORF type:complete len:705 (+),score=191.89 TRINITY_DN30872_c0_g1_i1:59-2173(+)